MAERQEPPPLGPSTVRVETARFRPLFARWINSTFRLLLGGSVFALVAVPASLIAWARTPYSTGAVQPIPQPVLFDHRHHTRDDGIDCRYCHYAVERSPFAGVPSSEICMQCHAQIWNHAPAVALVRASVFTGKPIEWQRVFNVPDFVFFNHAAHVLRNVGCVSCHGRVDQMAHVYMPEAMTMDWCLECHRAPENHLRPITQMTNMQWAPREQQRAIGLAIKAEKHIAPPTNCTGCHR